MGLVRRVLLVVTKMDRGGLESRLMEVYRCTDRTKLQFDFYTFRQTPGHYDEEIVSLGGKVYYSDPISPYSVLSLPRRMHRFFAEHPEYEICHAQFNQWCGLVLEGARRAGVPMRIAHSLTALSGGGRVNCIKNLIKHLYPNSATHRFAVSQKAALWLFGARRVAAGQTEVWPNAIDARRFEFDASVRSQTRDALGLGDSFTMIHVGNLRRVKNHDFLFSVFAEVLSRIPDSTLLVVGDGERREELHLLAKQLGIADHVRFLGSRSDIPALLCAADVFVFPSFYEGLPGAVLEAEASGLPCLISDTIAPEVQLSGLVQMLSIEAPPALWAERVRQTLGSVRESQYDLFCSTGYDVKSLSKNLSELYESAPKKENAENA